MHRFSATDVSGDASCDPHRVAVFVFANTIERLNTPKKVKVSPFQADWTYLNKNDCQEDCKCYYCNVSRSVHRLGAIFEKVRI